MSLFRAALADVALPQPPPPAAARFSLRQGISGPFRIRTPKQRGAACTRCVSIGPFRIRTPKQHGRCLHSVRVPRALPRPQISRGMRGLFCCCRRPSPLPPPLSSPVAPSSCCFCAGAPLAVSLFTERGVPSEPIELIERRPYASLFSSVSPNPTRLFPPDSDSWLSTSCGAALQRQSTGTRVQGNVHPQLSRRTSLRPHFVAAHCRCSSSLPFVAALVAAHRRCSSSVSSF
jgi:hypothetical protein